MEIRGFLLVSFFIYILVFVPRHFVVVAGLAIFPPSQLARSPAVFQTRVPFFGPAVGYGE